MSQRSHLFKLASIIFLLVLVQGCGLALPEAARPETAAPVEILSSANGSGASFFVYLPYLSVSQVTSFEEQLIQLINAERVSRGLPPVAISSILIQVAEAHSQDMVDRNFFSHNNPDGLSFTDRLDNAGYPWRYAAENIGGGQSTPQQMFNSWMGSAGHRDNLLSPNVTEIGIGYVAGGVYGHYWTAVFADRL